MALQHFSGYEYLQIDIANQMGHDKLLFDERIAWVQANHNQLESLAEEADKPELYIKAVMALRKAERGEPTGHRVGFDATCSGLQIMSAITGCETGAYATGLIDPNMRADAYTTVTDTMNTLLQSQGVSVNVPRDDAKTATMTVFYGSKEQPKKIFGDQTPELEGFYQAIQQVAPGAFILLQELLGSWQPFAPYHRWLLPDGFVAKVKVMEKVEKRLEVDELDHATFTYEWYENEGTESGLSNVANVVHSIDAYVLRSLIRRCSYDPKATHEAMNACFEELVYRELHGMSRATIGAMPEAIEKYNERFTATNMVDAVIIPHLNSDSVRWLSTDHLRRLNQMMEEMLDYPPFPITSVHDEFYSHPNHMNVLRQQYVNILVELANSIILDDIMSHLHGTPGTYAKLLNNLSEQIKEANYALS